jgi:hypothetical protein
MHSGTEKKSGWFSLSGLERADGERSVCSHPVSRMQSKVKVSERKTYFVFKAA